MYKIIQHQTQALFNYNLITAKKARITWVDFVLEVFKVAEIDDYHGMEDRLIPEEMRFERERIMLSSRKGLLSSLRYVVIFSAIALVFLYLVRTFFIFLLCN